MAINLNGRKGFNNLYFGDRSELVQAQYTPKARGANDVDVPIRFFMGQNNFVDTEPSALNPAIPPIPPRLPLLPGQPMTDVGKFVEFTVASGSSLLDVFFTARAVQPFDFDFLDTDLLVDPTTGAVYLISFDHANARYPSITTASYTLTPVGTPTDPVVNNMWTGWGVTYFTGTVRPARFESYPLLALNQYEIHPNVDGSPLIFTVDYTKTESVFFF